MLGMMTKSMCLWLVLVDCQYLSKMIQFLVVYVNPFVVGLTKGWPVFSVGRCCPVNWNGWILVKVVNIFQCWAGRFCSV